ncbi:MAG TPA: RNA 2',3'-cyclic phosphodiesterase [Bacteroidales bacterium]|nr:RNA 2',3'-cyclic phosphodiesterase [Bacteroidales bacterium]
MMTEFIRSFLAIELPQSNQEEVLDLIRFYRELTPSEIKWVGRENLHITLKFLGRFQKEHIKDLRVCLVSEVEKIPSFPIAIDRLGAFPIIQKPKVIWLGFDRPKDLNLIFSHIEDCVVSLGYEVDDRPFSPHLTLGRIRRDASNNVIKDISQILMNTKFDFRSVFCATKLTLFQSELTKKGPIYSRIFDLELAS